MRFNLCKDNVLSNLYVCFYFMYIPLVSMVTRFLYLSIYPISSVFFESEKCPSVTIANVTADLLICRINPVDKNLN